MSTATVTPTTGKAETTRPGVIGGDLPETMRALVVLWARRLSARDRSRSASHP